MRNKKLKKSKSHMLMFYLIFLVTAIILEKNKQMKIQNKMWPDADDPRLSLRSILLNMNWNGPYEYLNLSSQNKERLIRRIMNVNIREPYYQISPKCQQPILSSYTKEECGKMGQAFTGELRRERTKMAHVINLGFDVDVLEIHLNEIYQIVDKIFICECELVHGTEMLHKNSTWKLIKDQKRFLKFSDKIVHFWMAEKDMDIDRTKAALDIFYIEHKMEELRWKLFLEWNKRNNNFFKDTDLIGFGDADEIASVYALNKAVRDKDIRRYRDLVHPRTNHRQS